MCCNICSDKICDFYEFRLMCTSTDIQTRKLLGLPPSNATRKLDEKLVSLQLEEKPDIKPLEIVKDETKTMPKAGPKSAMEKRRHFQTEVIEKPVEDT